MSAAFALFRNVFLALLACALPLIGQAHEHLAAGAAVATEGSALLFVNAAVFAAESGYTVSLNQDSGPEYGDRYHANLTFVALAATPDYGGPVPFHPVLGSRIATVVESVEGPGGGRFGFWESVEDTGLPPTLTFEVPVGETQGSHLFPVSENDGSPGSDPYGHVHGRVFSTSLPGLYTVGFRFVDLSTLGPDGGPLHTPSSRFFLLFQAGVTLNPPAVSAEGLSFTFGTQSGYRYRLEGAGRLDSADWTPLSEALPGNDHLQTVTLNGLPSGIAFYRLRRDLE